MYRKINLNMNTGLMILLKTRSKLKKKKPIIKYRLVLALLFM